MTEPIIFKQSVSIGLLTLLQTLASPAIVFACLYGSTVFYEIPFDPSFVILAVLAMALAVILLQPSGGVTSQLFLQRAPMMIGIVVRWFIILGALFAIGYLSKSSSQYSRRVISTWALITPVLLVIGTLLLHWFMRRLLTSPSNSRSVIFAGCNDVSLSLADRLQKNSELCMSVTGFFDDRSAARLAVKDDVVLLGKLPELATYVKSNQIEVIFIALPIRHITRVLDLLDDLRDTTASIYYVPDIFVFDLIQARTGEILGIPVVSMCETPFYGLRGVIKRLTDIVFSAAILLITLPLFLVISVSVRVSSNGPVIFKQRRYGLDGRQITVYKFRTMTVTEDGSQITQATKEDGRITPVGRFLRRYSLDELPQLLNVLQGRMSLVGPRPHAIAHNEEYRKLIKGYMVRHKVLPGITGLAQVNGCRGETARLEDMQARVNYDLDYLRHWSPILDLKILFLTVLKLLSDDRAY